MTDNEAFKAEEIKMAKAIENRLGEIYAKLENIEKALDKLPCLKPDDNNPTTQIAIHQECIGEMKSRMRITERIGAAIAALLTAAAAWFVATGGDSQ